MPLAVGGASTAPTLVFNFGFVDPRTISTLSTELIGVSVVSRVGDDDYDPVSDRVYFAFSTLASNTRPADDEFHDGEWEADTRVTPPIRYAKCLVGPTSDVGTLAPGTWWVYVKVIDNPAMPVRRVGTLFVV